MAETVGRRCCGLVLTVRWCICRASSQLVEDRREVRSALRRCNPMAVIMRCRS
jgi:hypothetical protein